MKLFEATKINQGKNTVGAIKWFNSLKDNDLMNFVMFDIKDFYPSITQDIYVIHHAMKSLLFDGSHTWIKK